MKILIYFKLNILFHVFQIKTLCSPSECCELRFGIFFVPLP